MTKVLFVTYDFPYPLNSGGKSRAYNLIKFGQAKNTEVYLLSFVRGRHTTSYNKELEAIGVKKIWTYTRKKTKNPKVLLKTAITSSSIFKNLYYNWSFERKMLRIIADEKIDIVHDESFYTSFFITPRVRKTGVKQIFGTENIEHMLYFDFAKTKPAIFKKLYMVQVERVRREEERAYKDSDHILSVTSEEKQFIEKKTKTPISVIPNGIDAKHFAYKYNKENKKKLLFVGNFAYFPNIDAMDYFYKNIFQNIPDATLTVVGKNQNKLPFLIRDSRVTNIEYVEDLRQAYYDADIFVFPVRFGGGTNFKVLEAASCGTPILAIPDRVKGLGFLEDKQFVSARTPAEFMTGIRRLSEEKGLAEKISKNARTLVEKEYDWREIGDKMNKVWTDLAA